MESAKATLDANDCVTEIDERLYGNFVEHLGRCVYGGIYEPGHATADAAGWRHDVLEMTQQLAPPIVRYPGGNFVSAYRWEDGVGAKSQRPQRIDLAWQTMESNQVGTNDFMDWCKLVGTTPMMAVNLGTRGIIEACQLLEYCNHPSGTSWSDLRISHGYPEPHAIKTWCLGNEMDGPWQTGHKTAGEYGRIATETARAMRQYDASLELVACGSCGPYIETYPEWDRVVLDLAYEQVDYLSVHLYVHDIDRTPEAYLGVSQLMERQLRTTLGLFDFMKSRHRSKKTMMICFDEWNVWNWNYLRPEGLQPWQTAPPLVEQIYRMIDTVVFGSLLITLLKHADRVRIACVAQLVNVIGPIMTETGGRAWKQGTYHVLDHGSRFGRGEVIHFRLNSPTYECSEFGTMPYIDAVATRDLTSGEIAIFSINRHLHQALDLSVRMLHDGITECIEHISLFTNDPEVRNSPDQPEEIHPRTVQGAQITGDQLFATLPALSWNVIRLRQKSHA